jgi:hypothetical protein
VLFAAVMLLGVNWEGSAGFDGDYFEITPTNEI